MGYLGHGPYHRAQNTARGLQYLLPHVGTVGAVLVAAAAVLLLGELIKPLLRLIPRKYE